ncbi:hypothetical protein Pla175_10200 [Pirellulimonas nuda]|uniref:Uncharacterized protein n=1 Tax=Pirellulimonas nuda TaxID=2528009 RepID=A0A518D865_9BACT|nr:hypothetical protein [Pirellulimonas nuda]QDU87654.1 hypothetical protein Pla175_10200 [Pirellulimonas nuda]
MSPLEETPDRDGPVAPPARRERWRPPKDIYSVPRRFDLASMLIVATAYALLLTALKALGADEWLSLWMVVFVTWVGGAQVVLFRGDDPRKASWIAGAVFCGLTPAVYMAWGYWRGQLAVGPAFVATTMPAILSGAVLGYLTGGLAAGVFLLIDLVRHWMERSKRAE